MMFGGTERVSIDDKGSLVVATPFGDWIDGAPVAFQEIDGKRIPVPSHYTLDAEGVVGFWVGSYDLKYDLVIDPDIEYATYVGGTGYTTVVGGDVGPDGDIFVGGWVTRPDFPGVDPTIIGGGSDDLFVA